MKLPKESLKMKLQYKPEPEVRQHPIRFATFSHDFAPQEEVEKYYTFTETWALSSLAGNEKFGAIPERLQNVVPSAAEIESQDQNDEEADTPEPTIPNHPDPQQIIDDQSTDDEDSDVNEEENEASDEVSTETPPAEPSLKVIKKKVKKDKLTKNSVMPTWSGTQHLLGKHKRRDTSSED